MNKPTLVLLFVIAAAAAAAQPLTRTMSRLPDTGQNVSYTSTNGEDSDYSIFPPTYSIHGNGTVTDSVTGLMWMSADGGEMTFENARIYADTLTFAGYNDWRLPTGMELFSIQHHQHSNPALDPAAFAQGTAEYWWSGETQINDTTKVWVTNAGGGFGNHRRTETISAGGTKRFHARAVRQVIPPVQLTVRFTDNGDGTVTDQLTDLIWQTVPYSDSLTWEQALNYADTLSLAGETDWRLPNIKELQSVTDLRHYNPSFDTAFFSIPSQGRYWSSTTLQNQPLQAWYLDVRFGITTYAVKTNRNLLLCVRGNTSISTYLTDHFDSTPSPVAYPNPFTIRFNLDRKGQNEVAVRLIDLEGRTLYTGCSPETQDFSFLSPGMYLLVFPDTSMRPQILLKK